MASFDRHVQPGLFLRAGRLHYLQNYRILNCPTNKFGDPDSTPLLWVLAGSIIYGLAVHLS